MSREPSDVFCRTDRLALKERRFAYVFRYVERNARDHLDRIRTANLYQYREPVSPHLARQLAPDLVSPAGISLEPLAVLIHDLYTQAYPKTNDHLLAKIRQYVESCSTDGSGAVYLETAGGVHSPSLHAPLTQIDSLRPLRLPTLLVASPHLGGISTTLSAYESLLTRGYTIEGVLGLKDEYYRNHEFLKDYFAERGIDFWGFETPHKKEGLSLEEDVRLLKQWYDKIEDRQSTKEREDSMMDVVEHLERRHQARIAELESMPGRTQKSIWWPFTQHGLVRAVSIQGILEIDAHQQHDTSCR